MSAQRAQEKRDAAAQLRKDADDMEARVKQMAHMETMGFYLCENGHERDLCSCARPGDVPVVHVSGCPLEIIDPLRDLDGLQTYAHA